VNINVEKIDMNKQLWFLSLLAAFLIPSTVSAQKLERTKNWEVGDRLTYNYVRNGKAMSLVEEVVAVTDDEIRMTQQVDGRTFEVVHSTRDLSRRKGICLPNGQACGWSPGDLWADFPLHEGKRWSYTATITGETFVSRTAVERAVKGLETIDTPAGRFDAYRISSTDRIESRGKTGGDATLGTASYDYFVTSIKGKLVFLKNDYTNSFGQSFSRELVSAEFK
jgi:hypothetical protein